MPDRRVPGRPSATVLASRPTIDPDGIRGAALRLFAQFGYRSTTMADIGAALGIRGPSLYKHVGSKQDLLVQIMVGTMNALIEDQYTARTAGGDITTQLRRMVEAHVRFHALNSEQAFVGNREIGNLEQPHLDRVLALRALYERGLRDAVAEGIDTGALTTADPRLASYAVLDMGIGVATWFGPDGPRTADQVAYAYADFALAIFGAVDAGAQRGATAATPRGRARPPAR
jgi:AcrR family transcriptional regulator